MMMHGLANPEFSTVTIWWPCENLSSFRQLSIDTWPNDQSSAEQILNLKFCFERSHPVVFSYSNLFTQ